MDFIFTQVFSTTKKADSFKNKIEELKNKRTKSGVITKPAQKKIEELTKAITTGFLNNQKFKSMKEINEIIQKDKLENINRKFKEIKEREEKEKYIRKIRSKSLKQKLIEELEEYEEEQQKEQIFKQVEKITVKRNLKNEHVKEFKDFFNNDDLNDYEIRETLTFQDVIKSLNESKNIFDKKILIKMDNIKTGEKKTYTLTPDNLERLNDLISKDGEFIETESDQIFKEAINNNVFNVKFVKFEKSTESKRERKKLTGRFFPYYNNTNIDLTRYDIYKRKEIKENIEEEELTNCFYIALKNSGLCVEKLEQLKYMLIGKDLPTTKIQQISDHLNIIINLKRVKEDDRLTTIIYKPSEQQQEEPQTYNLALFKEHYFINEKVPYTTYASKNYLSIYNITNYNKIYEKKGYNKNGSVKYRFIEDEALFIESVELIRNLYNINVFEKMDDVDIVENQRQKENKYNVFKSLVYSNSDVEPIHSEIKQDKIKNSMLKNKINVKKELKTLWVDFETYTDKENKHIPYLVCAVDGDNNEYYFSGENCGILLLKNLYEKAKINDKIQYDYRLIFHNAKYDKSFIIDYLTFGDYKNNKYIEKNNSFYSLTGSFNDLNVTVQDSYKLISMPLKAFGSSFNLEIKKEIMPYKLYNDYLRENIKFVNIEEVKKYIKKEDINEFINNCINWGCLVNDNNNELLDLYKYSYYYCLMDCKVLKGGYLKFKAMCLEAFNIDIDYYLTISSIADDLFKKLGCYSGVYRLSGIPRMFIQKCVVGGRVMCRNNKKIKTNNKITDYDGVSLYPSAIDRLAKELGGFLKGKPKIIDKYNLNMDFLNKVDGYFIKIKINKVNKNRSFPLLSVVNEETKTRNFTNELEGKEIYIDKIALEDAVKFQNIEFDILQGYYFNEGRNNKCGEIINKLFNERIKLKQNKNPAQIVYKLLLNSIYGKTILKADNNKTVLKSSLDADKFINYHFNDIEHFKYVNENTCLFKIKQAVNQHFNAVHVGVEILSSSKRIMNEVITTAEDNELNIYYQDTDSLHIDREHVQILEDSYFKKYNRILRGEELGQFHPDFSFSYDIGEKINNNNIYAQGSYFLGKKCYIDQLKYEDTKGNIHFDYHIRMKGVSETAINSYCLENKISIMDLYESLYKGDVIEFDLTNGKDVFKFVDLNNIITLKEMKRAVQFK